MNTCMIVILSCSAISAFGGFCIGAAIFGAISHKETMSHPPEPLLSHNEESMTEHRKSHPLETSLSSRELAEQVLEFRTYTKGIGIVDYPDEAVTLIDAWVQKRETTVHQATIAAALQIFREQYQAAMTDTGGDREAATYCGLQAVERMTPADVVKQREGTL